MIEIVFDINVIKIYILYAFSCVGQNRLYASELLFTVDMHEFCVEREEEWSERESRKATKNRIWVPFSLVPSNLAPSSFLPLFLSDHNHLLSLWME